MALFAVIAVLLGGAAWLYVKHGDSFDGVSPFHSSVSGSTAPRSRDAGAGGPPGVVNGTEVNFAGRAAPIELPCAVRRTDIGKMLAYLTLKGRKTHADLVSVCRYYGTTVRAATS